MLIEDRSPGVEPGLLIFTLLSASLRPHAQVAHEPGTDRGRYQMRWLPASGDSFRRLAFMVPSTLLTRADEMIE